MSYAPEVHLIGNGWIGFSEDDVKVRRRRRTLSNAFGDRVPPGISASAMTIRKALLSDAPRLAELSGILGYPVEAHLLRGRLETILPKQDHAVFVAESTADSVVGWIHAADQEILEAGRFCEILGLVVAANQRRVGLGRRLVSEVERWATQRGIAQISVRSNIIRPESHEFYQQSGFVRIKTQHVYRKDLTL